MKEIDLFALKPRNQEESLLEAGSDKRTIGLKGSVLEKQIALNNGWYLVLTTANSPYDEALYATLINEGFKVLDQIELSDDITPGILKDVQYSGEYTLTFLFNQEIPYSLDVDINGFIVPWPGDKGKRDFGSIFQKKYMHLNLSVTHNI